MLLCCLHRNVEASCHKHFVVRLPRTTTTPLIYATSDECHQLATVRRSCVYNTWRPHRWQHAMRPDIGWKSRFLSIPLAFDAPTRELPVRILLQRLVRKKTRMAWLPDGFLIFLYVIHSPRRGVSREWGSGVWTTCLRLLRSSVTAGPRTRDHWIASPTPYRVATAPPQKKLKIYLFVSTEYTNVTDGQTNEHHMTA